ncbi:MAG: RdgB/HAM1 family non-canonical purine NTP pyrophosphatase [Alphaproteobacteria bacterium]|nr:RdgB/HAM1 family non-canonical purine NTP pyrophosphatase [Alphaproteobacteria bacterium]
MTRTFNANELVIASHNRGKLAEFQKMFDGKDFTITCAADHGLDSPPETGDTFVANATTKAVYTAQKTGKPALADDSGMCVNALDGAPGVYSADWAELEDGTRDFKMAMKKVKDAMGDEQDNGAAFVSCLVLAWPDGHVESVEGRMDGSIIWPPRGDFGHGYDPIFKPEGFDITYAEMPDDQKNSLSHRAIAFRMMMEKCF